MRRCRVSPLWLATGFAMLAPVCAIAQTAGPDTPPIDMAPRPLDDPNVAQVAAQQTGMIAAAVLSAVRPPAAGGLMPMAGPTPLMTPLPAPDGGLPGQNAAAATVPPAGAGLIGQDPNRPLAPPPPPEADLAGDEAPDPQRPPPPGAGGFGGGRLIDTSWIEAPPVDGTAMFVGAGNSSLWSGADGIDDPR